MSLADRLIVEMGNKGFAVLKQGGDQIIFKAMGNERTVTVQLTQPEQKTATEDEDPAALVQSALAEVALIPIPQTEKTDVRRSARANR